MHIEWTNQCNFALFKYNVTVVGDNHDSNLTYLTSLTYYLYVTCILKSVNGQGLVIHV